MWRSVSFVLLAWLFAAAQERPNVPAYWAEHIRHSPDGRLLAVGKYPQGFQLWEVKTGRLLNTVPDLFVQGIGWSPDGKRLAVNAAERRKAGSARLEIRDPMGAAAVQTFRLAAADQYFDPQPQWSPDGRQIAVRTSHGAAVLNPASGQWTAISEPGTDGQKPSRFTGGLSWGPDSRRLALVAGDRESDAIDIWDIARMAIDRSIPAWQKTGGDLDNTPQNSEVAWSADGRWLALSSRFRYLSVWDARAEKPAFRSFEKSNMESLSWSADSRLLQVGTFYQVRFLRPKDGTIVYVLQDMGRPFRKVSVSPQGNEAAGAELDATVVFWRGRRGIPAARLLPDGSGNWRLSASPR